MFLEYRFEQKHRQMRMFAGEGGSIVCSKIKLMNERVQGQVEVERMWNIILLNKNAAHDKKEKERDETL